MKLPYKYASNPRIYCLSSYKNHSNFDYFLRKVRQKTLIQVTQTMPALLALLFF